MIAPSTGIVFALALATLAGVSSADLEPAPASTLTDSTFASADSLPRDPKVRTGTLPNGLRYFIRANKQPRNRAELRLVVNAGSVLETDQQLGYAHFIEHMAFNGTEHFKKNDLVTTLQTMGVRFGADLNATTSFDETVYILSVPTDTSRLVDVAFNILADWAHGLTFDSAEVIAERGVVREEWRGSKGASGRMLEKWLPIAMKGSLYASRLPIGTEQSIMSATPSRLRAYYDKWYRPDLMAVVAVGDFNPDDIEARIRARFAGIPMPRTVAERIVPAAPTVDSTVVTISTDREATRTSLSLWFNAARGRVRSVGDFRNELAERLFLQMLNERLAEAAQKSNPAFMRASASRQSVLARDVVTLSIAGDFKPGGLRRGTESLMSELSRATRTEFLDGELERARAHVLERLRQSYAERAATPSGALASEYVRSFLLGESTPGIEYEYELARKLLPAVTAREIQKLASGWVATKNRVAIVEMPDNSPEKEISSGEIRAALDRGENAAVSVYSEAESSGKLVESLRPAGSIVSRKAIAEVGVSEWKLSNGIRMLVKPTDYQMDEIIFGAYATGGTELASDADFISAALSSQIVSLSGLGNLDRIDLGKRLAGKSVSISATNAESSMEFGGRASVDHLETLFELIYLEFTAARIDTAAVGRYVENLRASLANRSSSPDAVFSDTVQVVMSQHALRSRPLTVDRLSEIKAEKAIRFFNERVANAGAFTFAFVGNVDTTVLASLAERYLASLPSTKVPTTAGVGSIGPPKGIVEKIVRAGLEQKATTLLVFTSPCGFTPEERFILRAATDALQLQLTRTLREQLGRTYSPSVRGTCTAVPRKESVISVQFTSLPADADTLAKTVFSLIDKLKTTGPDDSDVDIVKEQMSRARETSLRQNTFWLAGILLRDRAGEDLRDILKPSEDRIRGLTGDKIKQAVKKYFNTQNYVRFVLLPTSP